MLGGSVNQEIVGLICQHGGRAVGLSGKDDRFMRARRLEKVRADDGVHFERAGGDMIARVVLKELNKVFDLTSWRNKQTA